MEKTDEAFEKGSAHVHGRRDAREMDASSSDGMGRAARG